MWLLLLGAYVAIYLSWQASNWTSLPQEPIGTAFVSLTALAAAGAAWSAARRVAPSSARLRRAWLLVSLALLSQFIGGVVRIGYEQGFGSAAYPTLADPFFLAFYPLLLAGVLRFPAAPPADRRSVELALDCAVVVLGGAAVFIYFVLGPEGLSRPPLQAAASIAHPVGSMVLLVALGAAALRTALPGSLRWVTAAMGTFAVADLAYCYAAIHGSYRGGDPIDALYVVAFACFAVAAGRQSPATSAEPPAVHVSSWAMWPSYVAVLACLATVTTVESDEPFFPELSVALIAGLVTALVVVRQLLGLRRLRESQSELAEAQRLAHIGSWRWDVDDGRLEHSAEGIRILGTAPADVPTSLEETLRHVHPEDRQRVRELMAEAVETWGPFDYEARVLRADGEVRQVACHGEPVIRGGQVVSLRGTAQDVTDRRRLERELTHHATRDPLTGLVNRRRLAEELDAALEAHRTGAIVLLDLDDFKLVNDVAGHAGGDVVLRQVADVLTATVRDADLLARVGGDEFAILLWEADAGLACAIAERVRARVGELPSELPIGISTGVATFDGSRDAAADDVLARASSALFGAKDGGKDQVRVYDSRDTTALTWVERIRRAQRDDRLVLYGQPIVDVASGRTVRHELLVRMVADDGELVPPAAFLPAAERFGAIVGIDRWVTGRGLELARAGIPVSVNLSSASIGDAHLRELVGAAVGAGVQAGDILFEITETTAVTNVALAREFAGELTDLGCDMALDDFGTGFASFTYLKHLPARYVKIDREFVKDMVRSRTDYQVVKAVNDVAHSLGKATIAEGVEDRQTLIALRHMGIDLAQGFFLGRPRPMAAPAIPEIHARATVRRPAGVRVQTTA
jgi:diguanylate cyclase (GGDEF)-like protein/PAS domain S-box-containing protein